MIPALEAPLILRRRREYGAWAPVDSLDLDVRRPHDFSPARQLRVDVAGESLGRAAHDLHGHAPDVEGFPPSLQYTLNHQHHRTIERTDQR